MLKKGTFLVVVVVVADTEAPTGEKRTASMDKAVRIFFGTFLVEVVVVVDTEGPTGEKLTASTDVSLGIFFGENSTFDGGVS